MSDTNDKLQARAERTPCPLDWPCERSDLVDALCKALADATDRVETLELDNAVLLSIGRRALSGMPYETGEQQHERDYIDEWLNDNPHLGAALLARLKRLEAVAAAAKALIDDLDVCGCTKGCGGYFGNVDEHPTAGRERFDALKEALEFTQ